MVLRKINVVLHRAHKQLNEYIDKAIVWNHTPAIVQIIFIERVVRGVKKV